MDRTHDLGELAPAWADLSSEMEGVEEGPEFTAVYEAHFAFVRSALARLGVPAHSLDDACQEAFLVVHRKLDDFEQRSSVRTWLYAITRRVASNYHRAAHRRERRHAALATIPVQHEDLEQLLLRKEGVVLLHAFLDRLDADKREAFVLGELEGLTRRELGDALGINPNTAYTRLQSARRVFERTFAEGPARDELVAQARRTDADTAEARRRVWAMMVPSLPSGATASLGSSLAGLWSQLAVFATTVALGTGIMVGLRAVMTPEPVSVAAPVRGPSSPSSSPPEAQARPASEQDSPPSAPGPETSTRLRTAAPLPSTTNGDLQAELVLLDRAASALAAGQADDALRELRRHETRFPRGQLSAEREVLLVESLCAVERPDEAHALAERFLAKYPTSALRGRLEATCAISSP